MKKGFSLLELIFAIVIIGVIASFAVPKFLDTKDTAVASTIKRDISSIISAVQTYYLQKEEITSISDAITYNDQNWIAQEDNPNKITDKNNCVTIEVKPDDKDIIQVTLLSNDSENTCAKLEVEGIKTQEYNLI